MKFNKLLFFLFLAVFTFCSFLPGAGAETLAKRLAGKILLQVEANGEAWYVNPDNSERYYLGRPADAFQIMRDLGLGASNRDFDAWQGTAPARLAGKIILKVEDLGKAYYISPDDYKLYYLGRPADAFQVMREQGLGITNANLGTIAVAAGYDTGDTSGSLPEPPAVKEDNENVLECPETECAGSSSISYEIRDGQCAAAKDDCGDCSCSCGGFNLDESAENDNCKDGLDNDCDGLADSEDAGCAIAGTEVSGAIENNTVWTLANSPYLVVDDLEIAKNQILTIEPGVEIRIYSGEGTSDLGGISLIVSGKIEAQGSADNNIVFASNASQAEKGSWGAIEVVNGGILDFSYVTVKGASTGIYGVNCSNIQLHDSVIENNLVGLYLNCSATASRNIIKDNGVGAIMANDTVSARDTGDYRNYNWLVDFNRNTVSGNSGGAAESAGLKFAGIKSSAYQFNVEYNSISANTNGLMYENTDIYTGTKVENNNIAGNFNYNLYVKTAGTAVMVENNWWGSDVSASIDETIFDYYDVADSLAQADYRPFKLVEVDVE